MRYKTTARTLLLSLLLLTSAAVTTPAARAADDANDDDRYDYDETARVARISLLSGDVSLRRAGGHKWERADLNFPLVEGDRLATGANSHVEVQIDARNFVRMGPYATLDVVTLRAEGVAFSVPEGTATIRLARFDHDHEYFEIDAPRTTIAAEQTGLYRIDAARNGSVIVTARDGARARLYSDTSGFTLRDGRTAELTYDSAGEGDWSFAAAREFDSWDRWNDDRERYLASRLRYDGRDRYYDSDVWGAEELDAYGDWVYARDYGYVWRPHVTVINNYNNWVPYRYGRWTWCPPYGWTWVGDEPWGWAPYHYGRWVYYNNYWCWAPRGYYHYRHHSWWRPALVAFVHISLSFGDHIAWYPLGYHQPDPHARYYRQPDRLTPLRAGEIAGLQRTNPIYQRAVTTLPTRDFGTGATRAQPAPADLAQRALVTDPVRGRLPVRPIGDGASGDANNTRPAPGERPVRGDLGTKLDPNDPVRRLYDRPTGAATRTPGKALGEDLKRERVFNNRTPRVIAPDATGGTGGNNATERGTGAVARPPRPPRDANADANQRTVTPDETRPVRDRSGADNKVRPPRDPDVNERIERKRAGEPTDDNGERSLPVERAPRPPRPDPTETRPEPAVRERPRVERPDPEERRPAPRVERPEPKYERPEPKHERPEPKYERPEPRVERERPAPPREERPPQREERPSAPPPREERSAPPPERSAPPPPREERRADPPRQQEAPSKPSRTRNDPPSGR